MKLRTILFHSRALIGLNGGLPDFLIIGAQKSGTTSLFRYLIQSPLFVRSAGKELHYFDRRYDEPFSYYRRQFPRLNEPFFTGEASPSYLFYDFVPERVAEYLPGIKLIATLRNPVDRALSQFNHNRKRNRFLNVGGRDITTFEEHVEQNLKMDIANEPSIDVQRHFHIVERGFYRDQIENWRVHFAEDQFHFVRFEDLIRNPQDEIDKVIRFLGRPQYRLSNTETFNSGGDYSRKSAPETLAKLQDLYLQKNEDLGKMTGFSAESWFQNDG